jgi:hypothetical protein
VTGRARKLALTLHVASSVGWLGAVVTFLGIAVFAAATDDAFAARGSFVVLDVVARYVLVPLSMATLVTGIVESLSTPWGVLRHYWVVIKLVITVVATAVLVAYTATLRHLASLATTPESVVVAADAASPIVHASGALVLLVTALVLSVFKPAGRTVYGRRLSKIP